MIVRSAALFVFGLMLVPLPAEAGEATVVLDVHHAYCALCPSIVKKTIERVPGVTNVIVGPADANGDTTATVKYDDTRGTPAAMIKAAAEQGYPAEVAKRTNG
jgi:periplasmic mercuric ion binding protein